MAWTVYILQCADKTLYTGITNNLEERLRKHAQGTGAKYTKGRGPFKLLFAEAHKNRGNALRREAHIKSVPKSEKLKLIAAENHETL